MPVLASSDSTPPPPFSSSMLMNRQSNVSLPELSAEAKRLHLGPVLSAGRATPPQLRRSAAPALRRGNTSLIPPLACFCFVSTIHFSRHVKLSGHFHCRPLSNLADIRLSAGPPARIHPAKRLLISGHCRLGRFFFCSPIIYAPAASSAHSQTST